jgi:hypothetical protein
MVEGEGPVDQGESLEDIAAFLSGVEAFRTLGRGQLARVAAPVTHRGLRAGEAMIVEGAKALFTLPEALAGA